MEHGIDDACGSLRFDLCTPQTKVGYLNGLHMSLGDGVKLSSECLEVPGSKESIVYYIDPMILEHGKTKHFLCLHLFLPSSVAIDLIWQPHKLYSP